MSVHPPTDKGYVSYHARIQRVGGAHESPLLRDHSWVRHWDRDPEGPRHASRDCVWDIGPVADTSSRVEDVISPAAGGLPLDGWRPRSSSHGAGPDRTCKPARRAVLLGALAEQALALAGLVMYRYIEV